MDPEHSIAHHKVMAIDGGRAITGAFDFTKAAEENNSENLLVIHDKTGFTLHKELARACRTFRGL